MMVRFDAYTATTSALKPSEAVGILFGGSDTLAHGRGFFRFAERVAVKDRAGDEVGAVMFGGSQGDLVMLEAKGYRTPWFVDRLRSAAEHRCTRVDSCVDVERPGGFDELLATVMEVKVGHQLYGERRGDWDFPEQGRTQYLGASSSPIRARLYEKGKQPDYRHLGRPDLVRLEIQVRPQKEAKQRYSQLSPLDVWGASKWTRELAGRVLEQQLDPHPPGTVRKDTKRDQALRWMCKQYGPHLVSLAEDLGSWDCLGLTLREMLAEQQRRKGSS
jgi:hypothetical protein